MLFIFVIAYSPFESNSVQTDQSLSYYHILKKVVSMKRLHVSTLLRFFLFKTNFLQKSLQFLSFSPLNIRLNIHRVQDLFLFLFFSIDYLDIRWKQFATTIIGGNGKGDELGQLNRPQGITVDDQNQMLYIADWNNHRIVEWRFDTSNSRVVAGGNGTENQLNRPTDVIIDRQNDDLIIVDQGNRRVMRCSRRSSSPPQIIINDIDCSCLTMDKDGSLYVSDCTKNEVRRWKKGETQGTVVAGGNGQGDQLNQLNDPTFLFIDDDHTLYISDKKNHRVMKWMRDAKQGIVVAGGNGQGDQSTQLSGPEGVIVDQFGQIYIVDSWNDRVMRWREGEKEGIVVVGGDGRGNEKNQLYWPVGLSCDGEGNLYVADWGNHRIEKFERDFD